MLKSIAGVFEGPARAWCKLMHPDPMWPVNGFYRCPSCLRQYPVQWEAPTPLKAVAEAPARVPVLRPELLPLLRQTVPAAVERARIKILSTT
jgi:hypothetical protein